MLIKKDSIMTVLGVLLLVGFGGYVSLSARSDGDREAVHASHVNSQCNMHEAGAATGGQQCEMHGRQSSTPVRNLLKYSDELGLSEDQVANLNAMRSDLFQKCGEIQRDMKKNADDLKLLMSEESTDPSLIDASLKEQQVLGEDLQEAMTDYNSSTLALLNSDQRNKLTELESTSGLSGSVSHGEPDGYHAAAGNSADCCAGSK